MGMQTKGTGSRLARCRRLWVVWRCLAFSAAWVWRLLRWACWFWLGSLRLRSSSGVYFGGGVLDSYFLLLHARGLDLPRHTGCPSRLLCALLWAPRTTFGRLSSESSHLVRSARMVWEKEI